MVIIPVVEKIGYHYRTKENKVNLKLIVLCYMIDMTILPILIGSNFSEYFIWSVFGGKHTDFSSEWYTDVGYQISFNMTLFAL